MLLQANDLGRLLVIYFSQTSLSIIFLIIAYKILKRNRSRLSLLLSGFYISEAIAFIINAIYVPLKVNPIVFVLYFILTYLVLFGQIFLLMFIFLLYETDSHMTTKKLLIIIFIYGVLIFSILYFSNGIIINEQTDWKPVWSWNFFMIVFFFSAIFFVFPFIFIFIKLYRKFEDKNLKKNWNIFF